MFDYNEAISKDQKRINEIKATLDYFQLIATYRFARLTRNYSCIVFDMVEGKKLLNKVDEHFNESIIDSDTKNIELLVKLSNNLSSLSTDHVSLAYPIIERFCNVSWIDYAIDCIDMEKTTGETFNNLNNRVSEMYEYSHEKNTSNYEDEDKVKLLKSIGESSERFKKRI